MAAGSKLEIKKDPKGQVYVQGAIQVPVRSAQDLMQARHGRLGGPDREGRKEEKRVADGGVEGRKEGPPSGAAEPDPCTPRHRLHANGGTNAAVRSSPCRRLSSGGSSSARSRAPR